ncbi:hypothetical protein BKA61DRAFT_673412 [Leptodontidium sp. MPI-SDFR-AT-0119]|nr:hypothetical protein BKA61DRAFT_673412 [Leptodontidium sp. MPI-SDFR-AT-0119]
MPKLFGVFALALLSRSALASPAQITTAPEYPPHSTFTSSCYSYTETVPFTGIVHCPKLTVCGPHPDCIIQEKSIIEVPCANEKCTRTPTVTVTAKPSCPTCQKGCGTRVLLETVTTGCPTLSSY